MGWQRGRAVLPVMIVTVRAVKSNCSHLRWRISPSRCPNVPMQQRTAEAHSSGNLLMRRCTSSRVKASCTIFSSRLSADTLTLLQGLRVMISASSAHVNAARMAERSLRHVAARTSFRLCITHSLMSALVMSRMGASARFPNHFRKCLYDVCALL